MKPPVGSQVPPILFRHETANLPFSHYPGGDVIGRRAFLLLGAETSSRICEDGRGDASEVEGIIGDRHEEIGGAENDPTIPQIISGGIILAAVPHQQVRIGFQIELRGQDGVQHLRRNLAAAAGAMAVFGKSNERCIHCFIIANLGNDLWHKPGMPRLPIMAAVLARIAR